MIDLLLRIGVSNLCVSLALAVLAWSVQRSGQRQMLAHLLWVLVLVKLVTPPLFTIPVVALPGPPPPSADVLPFPPAPIDPVGAARSFAPEARDLRGDTASASAIELGKSGLALLWLLGSAFILIGSLVRMHRFNRLLNMASRRAPPEIRELATELASRLGLRAMPEIQVTSAHLSPMVWWIGGKVRVSIPATLLEELEREELRWILAHELGHVHRRDHLVRWLEWLACVSFWWNPVAWWARRNLRAAEEACCDALVLTRLKPHPHTYASSLLNVVELLATPALRPPAMASEINSGGFLERRLNMIISKNSLPPTSRWLQAGVLAVAACLLPLGVAYAQKPDYEAVGNRLVKAVHAGELTDSQAEAMIGALARERFAEQLKTSKQKSKAKRSPQGDLANAGAKLKKAVAAGKLSEEDARAKLGALRRKIAASGEGAGGDGLRGHYVKIGVSEEAYGRMARHLYDNGIARERIEGVLRGMVRLIGALQTEGERFELNPRMAQHFEELGLTGEQIELVVGMSRRVAGRLGEPDSRGEGGNRVAEIVARYHELGVTDETLGWAKEALLSRGIEAEKLEPVLGGMLRVLHKLRSEGERFELGPGLRAYFSERIGLTGEEVDLVMGISRRIVKREEGDDRPASVRELRQKYSDIEKKIKAAVEAGKLSEEEAKEKLIKTREKMFPKRDAESRERRVPSDQEQTFTVEDYRRAEAELKKLVDGGKVREEDAEKRLIEMRKRIVD